MLFDIDKKILDAIEDEHEFESVHDSGIRRDKRQSHPYLRRWH